jgi:hypothetical protein
MIPNANKIDKQTNLAMEYGQGKRRGEKEEHARENKKQRPDIGSQKSPNSKDSEWNRMFFELMLFKTNNGHINVKSSDEEHVELYKWSLQQRGQYKHFQTMPEASILTEDRIKVLESVRFALTTRGDDHWNRNFERLREYKQEHNHVLVPRQSEVAGLGDWVSEIL